MLQQTLEIVENCVNEVKTKIDTKTQEIKQMIYSRDLQNVVKGDVLAVKHADVYYSDWELLEVDSVTAHRIRLTDGKVFYKSDGQEVSDRSFKYMAVIPTTELIQKIKDKDQQWVELRIKPGFFHGNTETFVN